ncbi:deoxyribodipyrimidine photolyase [Methyloprofundus sedimenti]|uniref:Deoxyribodipyrimidine photo-lyase n=1 Tax=Methyloprofundus sedimenti TaxID=1420851 RepID=A0A1V8M3W3_9GAMM|nr:deoxyribodipyrimidine photo-lyase [Methyloprofundus sedimenti]OQK16255.1 deoxyribodipyrimidine photolyase [Methyloprofundus sedimenti]
MSKTIIHWFRQDLRLQDNPALYAAVQQGKVLPVYILDDESAGIYQMGAASRCWLHHSLKALNASLANKLQIYSGHAEAILLELVKTYSANAVHWNRCYEPWRIQRDSHIKHSLSAQGIAVHSFNGSLLWEPWDVLKPDGTPYRMFTPFYRKGCLNTRFPRTPLAQPETIDFVVNENTGQSIESLMLLPKIPWDQPLMATWQSGEQGARQTLQQFLDSGLNDYKVGRNFPAQHFVSRLSPYLHFGELSPYQAWHALEFRQQDDNSEHFRSELGWREFSYNLLYHHPDLAEKNLQSKFDAFPWQENTTHLIAWQQGQTGIPIVDAGMRELWQTGYMHNRVRMIVGSFLVKNLLQPWQAGERWFWDSLVDADLANNSASWQWVAGCGADAAPYFRIFNPVLQGQKFDAQGQYTRQYVPELIKLPDKYLFNPWEAPDRILQAAGILLGRDYPAPIVELKQSRLRALAAFKSLGNMHDNSRAKLF